MISAFRAKAVKVGAAITVLVVLYFVSALIVFDFGAPSYAYDEEIYNGKDVAIGPKPRGWICGPTYHNVAYSGDEWPFKVYRPICSIWRMIKGFEGPEKQG